MTADADLVVVGFGSAGMTAAEFAVGLGLRVCVVERGRPGGDCLWTGCVPSKALVAAARTAHVIRTADRFGLSRHDPVIDRSAVWARVRAVRDEIAAGDDDPARFVAVGVDVRFGTARVTGPHEVEVSGEDGSSSVVTGRFILLCTGSRPSVPEIEGLDRVGHLTTETLFELDEIPQRIVFVGGGPVAMELAQACARLDITVTVLQSGARVLMREEPELVEALVDAITRDGVEIVTGARIDRIEPGPVVFATVAGEQRTWSTDAIVVAAGRAVDIRSLGLEAIGVETTATGVVVDARGRTSIPSIYAAGDITGRELFTHAAARQAVTAVRDAFFPGRAPIGAIVPWATFTDPELAHAGLTIGEAEAEYGHRHVRVHRWSLSHNDRAHTDGTEGTIVLVERVRFGRRRLVGAQVLSAHAGELIGELVLAIERRMSASQLGGIIHVYPTIATSIQQLGGRVALEQALKYRWLMKLGKRR